MLDSGCLSLDDLPIDVLLAVETNSEVQMFKIQSDGQVRIVVLYGLRC